MVWRRAGRRASLRLGSRARDEGCGAGVGVKSFSANDLRADAAQKVRELSRGCHSVWGGPTMATGENAMGTRSTRSTSVRVQARADRIRAHGLSIRYSR